MDQIEPDVLTEIFLPSAQGRRGSGAPQLSVSVVRSLTTEDIPLLSNQPLVKAEGNTVEKLKFKHHQIASLLAREISLEEISYMTGYSPSYVSSLKAGRDFADLVDYYVRQNKERLLDHADRLGQVGMKAIEELDERLDGSPEKFTTQQLLDVISETVVKPARLKMQDKGAGAGGTGAPNVAVQVTFVSSKQIEGKVLEAHELG